MLLLVHLNILGTSKRYQVKILATNEAENSKNRVTVLLWRSVYATQTEDALVAVE